MKIIRKKNLEGLFWAKMMKIRCEARSSIDRIEIHQSNVIRSREQFEILMERTRWDINFDIFKKTRFQLYYENLSNS